MKLVSDFDGVLTELTHEAERVQEIFRESLAGLPDLDKHFQTGELLASQGRIGWEDQGRISAFGDEDAFIFVNAMGSYLDILAKTDPDFHAASRETLKRAHISDFKTLASLAYDHMVKEVLASSHETPIDPATKPVLEGLMAKGTEVVVISNSGGTRIQDIFQKAKLDSRIHPEGGKNMVRVRGGAQKYVLAPAAQRLEIAGREVDVARSIYEQMIRDERPDALIGDVFSLDLAMPFAVASRDRSLFPRGLKLILRKRPYTPAWTLAAIDALNRRTPETGVRFYLLEDLRRLPSILTDT